jgi:cell wall-associated NlpC family hydrolase
MPRLRTLLTLFLCALALAGPATAARQRAEPVEAERGAKIVRFAKKFLGTRYVYGGESPRGFDCSGLVAYVYHHFGITLPHYTGAQFDRGRRIGRWALHPGDLVFFAGVSHVGIYVGHSRFIHAPHTGTRVRIASLKDGWYRSTYDGARRILAPA